MDKPPILFISSNYPTALGKLRQRYTVFDYQGATDKAALLAEAARHCRALFTCGLGWRPAFMDALPKLELIACTATGYDEFDVAKAARRGIVITNSPGITGDDVADLGMTLLLAAARKVTWAERFVRSRAWFDQPRAPLTRKVSGKRLGIVGLGAIGAKVARRAAGFDMTVAYHGPRRKDVPHAYYPDLAAMAAAVDFLMLTCSGGPATAGIVTKTVIDALGAEGVFVNVARGTCVDEQALIAALRAGRLGAAGLDVFAEEPTDPAKFAGLDNVVLTPHYASGTHETREAMSDHAIANLDAFFCGGPLLTPVAETLPA